MTKDKKFQYCEEENREFPFPYIKTDDGETINSLYDCCKHLNILCDKNEQLKKENEELKKQRYELYMDIARLFKEKEQLKQEIETLQEQIAHFDIGDDVND